MKFRLILMTLFLLPIRLMATDYIIGEGEYRYKALIACDAYSSDGAYNPYVWIVKAIDQDDKFIAKERLIVSTLDAKYEPFVFYFTHQTTLEVADQKINMVLWKHHGNHKTGSFSWDGSVGKGALTPESGEKIEDLTLTNCIEVP